MAPPHLVATTAREWAAAQGLCKTGRGRMPRAAKDAIEQALREGVVFDDPRYPSTVVGYLAEGETTWRPSKSARATQAKILGLSEDEAFALMTLRRLSFMDGANHRTIVTVTARRDLFRVEESLGLGRCITTGTFEHGWRSFPIAKVIKVGRRDVKAVAADKVRRDRVSPAKQRKQDALTR